jgi:hypothetical protein
MTNADGNRHRASISPIHASVQREIDDGIVDASPQDKAITRRFVAVNEPLPRAPSLQS